MTDEEAARIQQIREGVGLQTEAGRYYRTMDLNHESAARFLIGDIRFLLGLVEPVPALVAEVKKLREALEKCEAHAAYTRKSDDQKYFDSIAMIARAALSPKAPK